ncbi:hypothetical protein VKT23_019519 [Stygiomarasmius scandens]|uniref:EF-hand domain-containing protein n=1 Tax=Marasmiellus scandens TaxID=2682957 RepID=A0ABR1IQI9_9AGAR
MDKEQISEVLQDLNQSLRTQLQSKSPQTKKWATGVGNLLGRMMEAVREAQDDNFIAEAANGEERTESEVGGDDRQSQLNDYEDIDQPLERSNQHYEGVRERIEFLIADMDEGGRIELDELFSYLRRSDRTRKEKEDRALVMLLRRYRLEDRGSWQAAFRRKGEIGNESPSFSQQLRDSIQTEEVDKRIVRVHNALTKGEGVTLNEIVEHIMSTCALIMFASDYNSFTSGKGGRKRKKILVEKIFQSDSWYRDLFDGLSNTEEVQKMTELHEEFAQFQKEFDSITQAQNRLLQVYESFGMGVFLDPFWNIENLSRARRTPMFARILSELPEYIPRDRYDWSLSGLTEDQENAFHIVVWILAEKDPSFVSVFVKLMNHHPCDIIRHRDSLQKGEQGYLEPLEYEIGESEVSEGE